MCNSIQEFGVSLVTWLSPKEAGGNQGTERHTQSSFWSSCGCGINDIKVFIMQHYLVWNGSSVLKLPLNVKKMEWKEFMVFLSAKAGVFFLTERTPTSANATLRMFMQNSSFLCDFWNENSYFSHWWCFRCQRGAAWMVFPIKRAAVIT